MSLSFQLLYYKCQQINPNRVGSYITSPDWKKNKKEAANPTNKRDKYHQQSITETIINHEKIKRNSERITKIKAFVAKYKFEGINYPSEKDDSKKY